MGDRLSRAVAEVDSVTVELVRGILTVRLASATRDL